MVSLGKINIIIIVIFFAIFIVTNTMIIGIKIFNIVVFQEPEKLPTVRSNVPTRFSTSENPSGKPSKQ